MNDLLTMKDIDFKNHGVNRRAWLCPPDSETKRLHDALADALRSSAIRSAISIFISVEDQVTFLQEAFALKHN